jgi:pimeloyl-ACP methyl ester carboxylesterase
MRDSETLTLPGGRILSYAIYGSPVPRTTAFYFHAYPSSRKEGKLWHSAAAKLSLRLIAPDRPGMGNSSFQVNRTLLNWPADVLAIADHLKIQRFYVIGLSGGGPYALACVQGIPKERLAGAAVVSGLYPVSFGTAGMLLGARFSLWVGPWVPGLLGGLLDVSLGSAARNSDPNVFGDMLMKEIESRPEVDQAVMRNERIREGFIEGTREGLRQGGKGAGWEASINGSPWGFELQNLSVGESGVPLTLWHGTEDINCPPAIALKVKEVMPGAELRMKEGEGHVSYALRNQEEILSVLIGATDD